jgi:type IV secretion system protein VirD4
MQRPVRRPPDPIDTSWLEKQPAELPAGTQPYLGWDDDGLRFGSGEDSVGIVGPPRYGKTSGLIIPACLTWAGPLVSTSTRSDILRATRARRLALAAPLGGRTWVYDPFSSEFAPEDSLHWSPIAGCELTSVCYRRVQAMTSVAARGVEDASHWQSGAAQVLRAYFHAAALEGLPLARVRKWLGAQELRFPAHIIRNQSPAAAMWADDLEAVAKLGDRERGSFYQVARTTLEATAEPNVLASCSHSDLDIDQFLRSRSSLFIIGPSHYQQAIAPLVAGLVDAIAQRAAELAGVEGGRLDPPLLLALDEVANIAPVQSLPSLVSEGGGRGILTMWAVQSLAQLRARYGEEQQEAIIAATSAKLIFGGLSNQRDLENISGWAGQKRHNTSFAELPVRDIQQLPVLKAWLFYRSDPPRLMEIRPAYTVPLFAGAMGDHPGDNA